MFFFPARCIDTRLASNQTCPCIVFRKEFWVRSAHCGECRAMDFNWWCPDCYCKSWTKLEKAKIVAGGDPSKWPFYQCLDHLIGLTARIALVSLATATPLPLQNVPLGIPVGMRSVHHQQPQQENPKQKHASVAKASSGGFRFITVRARGLCKYIIPHLSDVAKLHKEVPTALKGAPKPNNFKSLMASKMAQLVFPRQALLSRLTASSQFHLEILRTMASIQERRRCVAR